jgi:2',3'-cyclic-nucleotide 2'-phosphodiesterase (5'-nucleotidase family)
VPNVTSPKSRRVFLALLLAAAGILPYRATAQSVPQPGKLVVLSTTDVKGELNPCGCTVPKGGLSRRASYRDSVSDRYGQVTLVDGGNFFPDSSDRKNAAWFLMDAMKFIGTDAVGTGANDLRFGLSFLKANVQRTRLPMTSANLIEVATGRPALEPWIVRQVGAVQVGYFSLIQPKSNLGPSRDSLRVDDPATTARTTIEALRKKGATVVILLSQLGKTETEDLVVAIPGIDVVICGPNVPLYPKGRKIKNTVATYGGDQGHYVGQSVLTLDKAGRMKDGESECVELGAEVGERPDILQMVKTFETRYAASPRGQ